MMLFSQFTKDVVHCSTTNSTLPTTTAGVNAAIAKSFFNMTDTVYHTTVSATPTTTRDTTFNESGNTILDSDSYTFINRSNDSGHSILVSGKTSLNYSGNTIFNNSNTILNNSTNNSFSSNTILSNSTNTVFNKSTNTGNTILNNSTNTNVNKSGNIILNNSTNSEPTLSIALNRSGKTLINNTKTTFSNNSNALRTTVSATGTSAPILNNSGSAMKTIINMWSTKCVDNCTCFKDIFYLGRQFDPPIQLNSRLKIVNCTGHGYMTIPITVPTETDVLYLNENKITELNMLPYLPHLIYLDLSNNHIRTMDNHLFAPVQKLKHLTFANNQLQTLHQGSFSSIISLDNLDLSFNQISSIHPHAFARLNHLKSLNLRGNRLTNISRHWFQDVFDIRELDLSKNLLTTIDAAILDPLTRLYAFNLADNKIRNIQLEAFRGLQNLTILNLSNNQITQVPTYQLRSIRFLRKIILNGNLMSKIKTGDFSTMNITFLSISFMDKLVVIEKLAFYNLPYLVSLHAHDNPKLIYIDHNAFQGVPNLQRLYVHNDKLSALSPSIINFLPNLEEIHLYHNPLRCDCNAFWVKENIESAKESNYSKPYFNHSKFIRCGSPLKVAGRSITDVNAANFSHVCAPTTLQLFDDNYQLDLGEELRLECHAFGVPDPTITWILPNRTIIDPSVLRNGITKPKDKISLIDDCVLIIKHLNTKDSGTYSCKSYNGIGYDISSTKVTVANKPVRLVPYTINSDYISISWNGTQHKGMISDYQLHYREIGTNDHQVQGESIKSDIEVIQLGPQYHSYTVTKLKPQTKYEFCLVYVYKQGSYKVDCQNISTHAQTEASSPVKKIVSDKLVIGVCTAIGLILLLSCIIMLVKKFCGQKDYEHPYDSDESETINIPLDNLYQPLSVPICSSKTSLLNKHLD